MRLSQEHRSSRANECQLVSEGDMGQKRTSENGRGPSAATLDAIRTSRILGNGLGDVLKPPKPARKRKRPAGRSRRGQRR